MGPNSSSFKAMQEFCINDENVKLQLAKEREAEAMDDFEPEDENWQMGLELSKTGDIKTLSNIVLILRHDKRFEGIAYNQHRDGIDVRKELPWKQVKPGWNDSDSERPRYILISTISFRSPKIQRCTTCGSSRENISSYKGLLLFP